MDGLQVRDMVDAMADRVTSRLRFHQDTVKDDAALRELIKSVAYDVLIDYGIVVVTALPRMITKDELEDRTA